jgi:hypothetical protein
MSVTHRVTELADDYRLWLLVSRSPAFHHEARRKSDRMQLPNQLPIPASRRGASRHRRAVSQ